MSKATTSLFAALVFFGAAQAAAQKTTITVKEEKAGMLKEAVIRPEAAERTALARVPKGTISSAELEREGGRLIYSFDIKVPGKSGIEEINVDAKTGKVVAHEHEGPAKEKAEARTERKDSPKPRIKKDK